MRVVSTIQVMCTTCDARVMPDAAVRKAAPTTRSTAARRGTPCKPEEPADEDEEALMFHYEQQMAWVLIMIMVWLFLFCLYRII